MWSQRALLAAQLKPLGPTMVMCNLFWSPQNQQFRCRADAIPGVLKKKLETTSSVFFQNASNHHRSAAKCCVLGGPKIGTVPQNGSVRVQIGAQPGRDRSNYGNRQSVRRVPRQSGSSSSASAVPGVRAGPTLQSYGASSTFVAQADTTVPVAWGHQQGNSGNR